MINSSSATTVAIPVPLLRLIVMNAVAITIRNAVSVCVSVSLALSFAANWLLVRLDVEVDEQEKVAGEQSASEDGGAFGPRAASASWQNVPEITGNEVGITGKDEIRACKVHHEQVDDKLSDLH